MVTSTTQTDVYQLGSGMTVGLKLFTNSHLDTSIFYKNAKVVSHILLQSLHYQLFAYNLTTGTQIFNYSHTS